MPDDTAEAARELDFIVGKFSAPVANLDITVKTQLIVVNCRTTQLQQKQQQNQQERNSVDYNEKRRRKRLVDSRNEKRKKSGGNRSRPRLVDERRRKTEDEKKRESDVYVLCDPVCCGFMYCYKPFAVKPVLSSHLKQTKQRLNDKW